MKRDANAATCHEGFDKPPVIGQNVAPMDVVYALLADGANVSQEGKLNILGSFAHINATSFPARHPEMHLVIRLESSPAEIGSQKKLEIKLLDEDANVIGTPIVGDLTVPPPKEQGQRIQIQAIMRLVDTVFPKKGRYVFAVLVDGKTEAEVPLSVG